MSPGERRRIQRFEVIEHLGTGGMGSVYRARDPQLERDVAIKVLNVATAGAKDMLSDGDTIDLRGGESGSTPDDLMREARMMARLSHPNVLPVYEVGLDDGAVFVVMEHIDGSDLAAWLAKPRSVGEILDTFAQAGRGLAAAHARGIVHRDFKPANVLIGRDHRVRVADFGLSGLVERSPTAMVRIDHGHGTPRYMAPELWEGRAATTHSDAFAFCVALAEALGCEAGASKERREQVLRERGVSAPLQAAIAAGLGDDPAARPDLPALIAAIEGKSGARPRRRWWLLGGTAAVAAAGATVALALGGGSPSAPSCEVDPSLWKGQWDAERHTQLRTLLDKAATPATREKVDHLIAEIDGRRSGIDIGLQSTCRAEHARELTAQQARERTSCIWRRIYELDAVVSYLIAHQADPALAAQRIDTISRAVDCDEMVAPPLPADRRAILKFYDRWVAHLDLARPELTDQHTKELTAIVQQAHELGEAEIAVRATLSLGFEARFRDKLAEADELMQNAYRGALDLHSTRLATLALLERSDILMRKGDTASGASVAGLAQDLADKPSTPPRTRARVYRALGSAAASRGDFPGAVAWLQKAFEIVKAAPHHELDDVEIQVRHDMIDAMLSMEGREAAAVALARESAEFAKKAAGEHSGEYSIALVMLAQALRGTGQFAEALPYQKQALAIILEVKRPGNSEIFVQRAVLAETTYYAGQFVEARDELTKLLAETEHNPAETEYRPEMLDDLGKATFDSGQYDEGLRLLSRGIEESTSQRGRGHPHTLAIRLRLLDKELEVGRLDDAEHDLAALEEGYKATPSETPLRLAHLHGIYQAALERAHDKPRKAEALTREALATWQELKGDSEGMGLLYRALGEDLIAQGKWTDARAALDKALELARNRNARADVAAIVEVDIARVEAGLGQHADAVARAEKAKAVLDAFPGAVIARTNAAALLSRKH